MAFRKENYLTQGSFNSITISLASPEQILEQSSGEVLKPETINYRTYKPERDGLFCERIFGPVKDYECHCGKYKRIRYKGIVCDRCGVEVTEKKVRRERMGHIQLVVPVSHIWFFRSLPNKIGALLGLQSKKLDTIIYYERYVVINPGIARNVDGTDLNKMDFLTEEEYFDILETIPVENQSLDDSNPDKFVAKMGADAIYDILSNLDLDKVSFELRHKANTETSQQRKQDALKRLQVFEAFREAQSRIENRPEWMIVKVVPVIPPELRPLVPLDGGRFATSDLNDLYRRVIIRNNRLKRLIEIKAPDVIMRNEKRMLQEAVDSLYDNSRKANSVKTDSNRALKSLSDSLKGKQGRFRQNLLGKRVDYSGRSVIVVGPELKLNECGLPKGMASELFKPFIIRKLLERGIVKTVKSAKKIVDRKDPVVWDILENILKGHPVMLNRAPTLHRLGIQAFQPKLIEGKAIQLHPLVCTAFNADFDGDQMAVHVPLGNAAILEAQTLMLASHNILNPANGAPITVPSQDMVLGLYYMTKPRKSTEELVVKGEGYTFYSPEEVIIAYNEKSVDLHAIIKVKVYDMVDGEEVNHLIETTVGRVLFNQVVPRGFAYINQLLTKKSLRDIIGDMIKVFGTAKTTKFLDDIKSIGYNMAFKGGLSFNLGDVIIPEIKEQLVIDANQEVNEVMNNYNMGFITNTERYNQIIDIWTHANSHLTHTLMTELIKDKQGFNSVYMMLDSGARGSKEQIRQLSGMRGLMAKPQKSGASGGEIIENPILSNFKEGLSVLEYFISTHGARKGLADTALKTADAGYLTRRLVDVAQDVIISEPDCGTLRGLSVTALKKGEETVETIYERILGRTTVYEVYHPVTKELIVAGGDHITEEIAKEIETAGIESVEIRSVLTCESKKGVCAKCYGRNLASGRMVQKGEAVGVIAAQSIGEPGTQLTLRTFHVGGTASNIATASKIMSKFDGELVIDELRTIEYVDSEGEKYNVVIGRSAEMKIVDKKTNVALASSNIPYGSKLYKKPGDTLKKEDVICEWDPYNAVIISEVKGKVAFENIIQGITFRVESDEQTGFQDKVVIETKKKGINPNIRILNSAGEVVKIYDIPVGSHIIVNEKDSIKAGEILVKIPRAVGKSGDITGGLPRVTELFEARNPSDPAKVAEIDGVVSFGKKLKRGNREVIITSKTNEQKKYLIATSKQILAQENDFVKSGTPLSEGAMTPADILAIKGPMKVQEYIVNEIQEVYRLQGVKINDKHFEVIVRQMMRKVEIMDQGDTKFLEGELANRIDFLEENDFIFGQKVVEDPGDSTEVVAGQIITARKLREDNSMLRRKDLALITSRDAKPATGRQVLQGITRASLQTKSFISAASFQETTKVLTNAAINAKRDHLLGLKENVIVGHLIPAGTGLREYENLIVGSSEEYQALLMSREESLGHND
ncbi:DNA-directed RNA polymerase subunit beta' [Lentimicrobium sp. L6]|uniref:DNA-directed RNA polymerase subunit beta' n=1 Tax=Lentimicrobium sp. L6 TaxID=2735916 RepID=UPI0015536035|nr:DNA-directed RNA polymerase subunit beta' [Lentimicrobium sp. L6]NPD83174.1 DNA-directed RNA polymerase subunit beta' [Lentimicrobium sp. L6]